MDGCVCVNKQASDFTARFMEPSDYEKVDLYATHFAEANRRIAMRDFVRLNVYVADGNVLQIQEQEDYVSTQLLADIGGQLGLWVGVSVITLAELFELLLDFIHHVGRVHGPYARGREFSRTGTVDRSAAVSGCSQRAATPSCRLVCHCGARYCEAAERRVSLSLTSRRRRCTSSCDCAFSKSRADVTSLSHVGDPYDSVLPRSTV